VTVEELPRAAAAGSLSAMNSDVTRSLDLMAKAQHGDKDALNRLIARYYDRVRSIVHVSHGGAPAGDPRDRRHPARGLREGVSDL
jgi:hypothetical protein